jgi:hypothetical protein
MKHNDNNARVPVEAGKSAEAHPLDGLMDPRTCAAFLSVSVLTLSSWRARKRGPAFIHLGSAKSAVRYKAADVQRWLDAHAQGGA